jgi:Kef-type K+ transport system membrane component KefB
MGAIVVADFFGFVLAVPVSLFLAFWMSSVKNKAVVIGGGLVGAFLSFVGVFVWLAAFPLPGANGASVFFGSLLLSSVTGLTLAVLTDVLVARRSSRNYLRQQVEHESGV